MFQTITSYPVRMVKEADVCMLAVKVFNCETL